MRDGRAERTGARALGIDVDPLVVARGLGELLTCSCVMVIQSVTATSWPTLAMTSEYVWKVFMPSM